MGNKTTNWHSIVLIALLAGYWAGCAQPPTTSKKTVDSTISAPDTTNRDSIKIIEIVDEGPERPKDQPTPDEVSQLLTDWKPGLWDESRRHEYNQHGDEWEVFLQNGEVRVKEHQYQKVIGGPLPFDLTEGSLPMDIVGANVVHPVDDGWLVSADRGEWGGSLYWFDPTGENHYKIDRYQGKQFIEWQGHLLLIEGLSHLGLDRGQAVELVKENGKWVGRTFVDFKSAPRCALILDNQDLLICLQTRIVRLLPEKRVIPWSEEEPLMGWLYPNSMVEKGGFVYLGMRAGVLKVTRSNPSYRQFLVPVKKP